MFHLHLSYSLKDGAAGLDIFEAIEAFNKKHGFTNFKFTTRISENARKPKFLPVFDPKLRETPQRESIQAAHWNQAFIRMFLLKHNVRLQETGPLEGTLTKRVEPQMSTP